jgi:NAD(P)-dependent dehydrogenase (short-subunit alcohol dehydrogenase family)
MKLSKWKTAVEIFKLILPSVDSIDKLFADVGPFDALICAAGDAHFGPLDKMTEEEHMIGIKSKLMGQVNLVLRSLTKINDGGSYTLTSGVLSQDPIPYGSSVSMVNAGVEGFVRGAAIEMLRGIRINVVCPNVVEESLDKVGNYFRGHIPVPASRVRLGV